MLPSLTANDNSEGWSTISTYFAISPVVNSVEVGLINLGSFPDEQDVIMAQNMAAINKYIFFIDEIVL